MKNVLRILVIQIPATVLAVLAYELATRGIDGWQWALFGAVVMVVFGPDFQESTKEDNEKED